MSIVQEVICHPWSSPDDAPAQVHVMNRRTSEGLGKARCGLTQAGRGEPWTFIDPKNHYQRELVASAAWCVKCFHKNS